MPCEKDSVCLAAWQIHSSCSQKVLSLGRSHSQKLANWILTEEPLHESDVILQDREVPSASGRVLEHLSLFRYSEVVSLQYIVIIIHSKYCYISFTFLQPPMGLTAKANEVSEEWSWAPDSFRHRKGWRWLTVLCNTWLQILSWSFATFLPRQAKHAPTQHMQFSTMPWTLQVTAWVREQSQLSAHTLIGFQHTIVTDVDIFQSYLCTGGFEMFLTWGYLPINTTILCSCKHLQNEDKDPTEPDVQTPGPALRYVKNSVNLLVHLVEQRWVVFRAHSFWTVVSSFLLYLAKDSPKPRCITRLVRLSHASVSTVTLKRPTQVATFVAWDRWVSWEYLGKDDRKVSTQKQLKKSTLAQCI